MSKKIIMGLLALTLAAIWVSDVAALSIKWKRSVGVTVLGEGGYTFTTDIFGLPPNGLDPDENDDAGCGLIKGDVYCSGVADTDDTACDLLTGYSAALVLAADVDFIKPKTKPYRWSDYDLNSDLTDFGTRDQLRVLEQLALSDQFEITLPTGAEVNKAGIHAISDDVVNYWIASTDAKDINEALRKFVDAADGFGTNDDRYLQALPGDGMIPLYGDNLSSLIGRIVLWVVHKDQINGDDLHGKYRGIFAGRVIATTPSSVTFEALDADVVRGFTFYNDHTSPPSVGNGTGCTKKEVVVFAPGECADVPYTDDAYESQVGTITCGNVCKGDVELELASGITQANGDPLCDSGTTFRKFIPKNFGKGEYGGYAFIGIVESDNNALDELVICGDNVTGDRTNVEYTRYQCVPLEDVSVWEIPECCQCMGYEQEPNPTISTTE